MVKRWKLITVWDLRQNTASKQCLSTSKRTCNSCHPWLLMLIWIIHAEILNYTLCHLILLLFETIQSLLVNLFESLFDDQRICMDLEHLIIGNQLLFQSFSVFFFRVFWLKDRYANWLAFEFLVASIRKLEWIRCKISCCQTTIDFIVLLELQWPEHDSCCKIDCISKNGELFTWSWGTNDSRENISWWNTYIAPCVVNLSQAFPHV